MIRKAIFNKVVCVEAPYFYPFGRQIHINLVYILCVTTIVRALIYAIFFSNFLSGLAAWDGINMLLVTEILSLPCLE